MLKIRLARGGTKKRPYYSVVVADSHSPRDGRFIEKVGTYNPLLKKDDPNRVILKVERIQEWMAKGAQPTDRVARELGCRAHARLLDCPWPGLHQAELALAQRLGNLRGAFVPNASRRLSLQGLHVAVVDDVMTSGATLREAAAALRRGGATRVDAWVLARTPAPAD